MPREKIGELELVEDEMPEGWYVVGRPNEKVYITSMDYPRVEIYHEDGEYVISSKPEYNEMVEKFSEEYGFSMERENPPDENDILSLLNYMEEEYEED